MRLIKFAFVAAIAGCSLVAGAANALESVGCNAGVCLSFGASKQTMNLHMIAQGGATHFNLRNSCHTGQVEIAASGGYSITLGRDSPARCEISIQACNRGGSVGPFSGKSNCAPWGNWSLANPANDVVGGRTSCKQGFCAQIQNHASNNITIALTKWPSSTHRNIRTDGGQQIEGDKGTFAGNNISVQACNRGFVGKSSCTAWVVFD